MHRKIWMLTAACAFFFLSGTPSQAGVTPNELQILLDRYGKQRLIQAVLELRDNRVTISVDGKIKQFSGPPSPKYVTFETLLLDMRMADADVGEVKHAIEKIGGPPAFGQRTVSTVPSPGESAASDALRKAASECDVLSFSNFMPPSTRQRVRRMVAIQGNVNEAMDQLFQFAAHLYPAHVQRTRVMILFSVDGMDPQWVEVLGKKRARMLRQMPKSLRFFTIQPATEWRAECKVLDRFQACMARSRICRNYSVEDSAIQMKSVHGKWWLVDKKSPGGWKHMFQRGEGMVKILGWAKTHLELEHENLDYEPLIISLAKGYERRLEDLRKQLEIRR